MKSWKPAAGYTVAVALRSMMSLSDSPERALTRAECALLEPIYQGSVELQRVRVRGLVRGLLALRGLAFTLENTLCVPRRFFPLRASLLVHEICHVWQYQHGGHAYIADTLYAQNLGDGYRLEKGVFQGRPWHRLNSEQQATLVEKAWEQRCFEGARFTLRGRDCDDYLRAAMVELRAGRGATFH